MLRSLVVLSVLVTSSMAHSYGPYRITTTKPTNQKTPRWLSYYHGEVQETFYGTNMAGGFSSMPDGYVKVLTYCRGFSTNLKKMLNRALNSNEKAYIVRRLECATKGLNVDLLNYKMDDLTVYEKAHQLKNYTVLRYLDRL